MIKAGFSLENGPKCTISNMYMSIINSKTLNSIKTYIIFISIQLSVGRPKYNKAIFKHGYPDLYIGEEAQQIRGLLNLKYPIGSGEMINWDDVEKVWDYVYEKKLCVAPEEVDIAACVLLAPTFDLEFCLISE